MNNREFSRLFTEHRNKMPSLFGSADGTSAIISEADQESYFYPLQQAQSQDEYEKMLAKDSGWFSRSDHGAFGAVNPFYEMLYQQVLLPSIDNLYKAQYAAALEQGYDEHFDHLQDWGDKNASTWIDDKQDDTWWMDEQFKLGSSQPTEWSMWYNDQQKDLGIASDANELKEQLAQSCAERFPQPKSDGALLDGPGLAVWRRTRFGRESVQQQRQSVTMGQPAFGYR